MVALKDAVPVEQMAVNWVGSWDDVKVEMMDSCWDAMLAVETVVEMVDGMVGLWAVMSVDLTDFE